MSPKKSLLSAIDLPLDLVRAHRVMFLQGSHYSMTVITDQLKADLAAILTKKIGYTVLVEHIDVCGDIVAQKAYPDIMRQCSGTRKEAFPITEKQ